MDRKSPKERTRVNDENSFIISIIIYIIVLRMMLHCGYRIILEIVQFVTLLGHLQRNCTCMQLICTERLMHSARYAGHQRLYDSMIVGPPGSI